MKARTLLRHIRESIKSLGRNSWMTFASVSAVTVTLLLVGVFFLIMMNLNSVATSLEEDVEIHVYIDLTADQAAVEQLGEQIKALNGVEEVTFSSKDQELAVFAESMGDEGELFALWQQENPLHDKYIVKATDPRNTQAVANQIKVMQSVNETEYGAGKIENLFNILEMGRNVGLVLIVGLLFTAMFLISNTIKITILARSKEIEIMRLVGATNGFIRWPFFLEGMWLGVLGSFVPITIIAILYKKVYDYLAPQLESTFIRILDYTPFIYQLSGVLILLGALIGIWGSTMSIRKFLKA
ncbi:cell division transport system permease protein [Bacillus oleivorans]|uniref:Cell division protein FtsX n=1 Tax=Bacillus oleivorans TaxID=1448271 RepID=A0A285CZI5_9BACI|nr:permease-like cell division protein FtsX [Bacillus oleivorans]SNX72815.1 cell division transport system permease protein [Bacillus oleivorans]